MEKLVGHQRKKPPVGTWSGSCRGRRSAAAFPAFGSKSKPLVTKGRRVPVFESTAGVGSQVEDKGVIAIRNLATHHLDLGLDDLLDINPHSLGVIIALAIDHDPVRHSFNVE